jgi:hypothetical protein
MNAIFDSNSHVAGYLCPLNANTYGIEFLEFRIREMEGLKRELYNVKKPDDAVTEVNIDLENLSANLLY